MRSELIFGCVSGMIGVVIPLSKTTFDLLSRMCFSLSAVVKGVGGFSHHSWRAFKSDKRRNLNSKGFLDGDLLESFLDPSQVQKKKVVDEMNKRAAVIKGTHRVSIGQVTALIEEMS